MLLKLFLCLLGVGLCASQKVNIESRIIKGNDAKKCEFPWMAFIHSRVREIGCGGSIIDSTHILTAAHCVLYPNKTTEPSADLDVYFGASALEEAKKLQVKTVTPHEKYSFKTNENDVAILTLASPITFNDCTKPIPLVNATTKLPNTTCTIMGWGATTDSEKDPGTNSLKYATMIILNDRECQQYYDFTLPSSIFCARGMGRSDACYGDSGGPLVCKESSGKYFVYGVVSSGYECDGIAGFYMKVSSFIPWIQSKISN
ncbi:chymotrypsinogen A [Biomphalaria glabrata]|nr:chymotrypsinogen A [Biomphalaria glabrata]